MTPFVDCQVLADNAADIDYLRSVNPYPECSLQDAPCYPNNIASGLPVSASVGAPYETGIGYDPVKPSPANVPPSSQRDVVLPSSGGTGPVPGPRTRHMRPLTNVEFAVQDTIERSGVPVTERDQARIMKSVLSPGRGRLLDRELFLFERTTLQDTINDSRNNINNPSFNPGRVDYDASCPKLRRLVRRMILRNLSPPPDKKQLDIWTERSIASILDGGAEFCRQLDVFDQDTQSVIDRPVNTRGSICPPGTRGCPKSLPLTVGRPVYPPNPPP